MFNPFTHNKWFTGQIKKAVFFSNHSKELMVILAWVGSTEENDVSHPERIKKKALQNLNTAVVLVR